MFLETEPTSQGARADSPLDPVREILEANFREHALKEIQPVLSGIRSVRQDGQRITVKRNGTERIPLAGEFLNGNIKFSSVDIGDVSFDLDRKTNTASNIDGLSISMTLFGTPHTLAVKKARLGEDATGNKVLHTEVENPLPEPAQRILGMPATISVQLPVNEGGLKSPKLSRIFDDAAATTGSSIAGLLASDVLKEAAKVANFVESNPEWVRQVVDPVFQQIYDHLLIRPPVAHDTPSTNPGSGRADPANDAAAGGRGDGSVRPAGADRTYTVNVKGVERRYQMHIPPSYDGRTPMPVVILLHGSGQDGAEIARHTKFSAMADRKGFIAIYPDSRSWAGKPDWRTWDTDNGLIPPGADADDVSFLRSIIEAAEKDLVVDSKRIYMAGISNGGMMSFRAAGDLSDKLAAIAIVSGAMSGKEPALKAPVSVLNIHGTDDSLVPYEGLKNVPASLTAIGLPRFKPMQWATDFFVEQNRITAPPIVRRDGSVTERRFINANSGVEVNEYTIDNGRHIPDNIEQLTETIWDFFQSHPKAAGPVSGTRQKPDEQPFNITERIKAHVQARGLKGLEIDAGKMLNEVPHLTDGSFSPAAILRTFENKSGISLDDGVGTFVKTIAAVSKQGTTITLDLEAPQRITVANGGTGLVKLKSINVDDSSFDLISHNGLPSLTNIKGVSFSLEALGRNVSVDVREASQKLDATAAPYYRLATDNPLPGWARSLMLAKSQIPVEFRLNQGGSPSILNEKEIKDATLGLNPVTRGYIDLVAHAQNLYHNPSLGSVLCLGKDVGIFGASGFAGYRLAALKFATKGRMAGAAGVALLVAPSIIHGIERLID